MTDNSNEKAVSLCKYSSPGLEPLLLTKCSKEPSKNKQFNDYICKERSLKIITYFYYGRAAKTNLSSSNYFSQFRLSPSEVSITMFVLILTEEITNSINCG